MKDGRTGVLLVIVTSAFGCEPPWDGVQLDTKHVEECLALTHNEFSVSLSLSKLASNVQRLVFKSTELPPTPLLAITVLPVL